MLDLLKDAVHKTQNRWAADIRSSKSASTKLDMSTEILHLVQLFLRVVLFGTDVDTAVPRVTIQTRKSSSDSFSSEEMPLS